jgi:hypothetical protein
MTRKTVLFIVLTLLLVSLVGAFVDQTNSSSAATYLLSSLPSFSRHLNWSFSSDPDRLTSQAPSSPKTASVSRSSTALNPLTSPAIPSASAPKPATSRPVSNDEVNNPVAISTSRSPLVERTGDSARPTIPTPRLRLPEELPLAMLEPDPVLQFSEDDLKQIDAMAERFTEAVGRGNPDDPAYQQRWQAAREDSDEWYKARFGWYAFSTMQLQAQRLSGSSAHP